MANERDNNVAGYDSSPPTTWVQNTHIYPHSHHGTPAQEHSGFTFAPSQLPMEPSAFSGSAQQRPSYPQLIMPQWPSMNRHQTHQQPYQQVNVQPMQVPQQTQSTPTNTLPTPVSATSTKSSMNPRKTLTDVDRRRMCKYAQENPECKQTEIGAIFGVERSTVSKVLRQKEKYLVPEESGQSPAKRVKGRVPDIERALAVWAKNQERKGFPLTDDMIRDKARAFAATTCPDNQQFTSATWIEKFKLKNNLMGARSRKGSLAPDETDGVSATISTSHTPNGTSPTSPRGIESPSPKDLRSARSQESLKNDSPDATIEYLGRHGPFHSQSATSLNSAFTDTAPSSFSPGPLSPNTPFFTTPDSGTTPSPFIPSLTARTHLSANASQPGSQRPRSQTFPLLEIFSSSSPDMITPKYVHSMLDSPMEDQHDPMLSMDEAMSVSRPGDRLSMMSISEMRPPPLPSHIASLDHRQENLSINTTASLQGIISPDQALQAMKVVWGFVKQQSENFLGSEETFLLGKMMEKMEKVQLQTSTGT
ncbi:Hypothetical protein R9X50_00124600 [Acrodontium crateriforme]|uniref:HTH CENPB-type domain-containing protein n=1 Tax=Acrodontium crateriforme TaxID=150365 RepID=A0AAQ3R7Q9_9PEZI|nr:Hypothetical protein R9X50_00124600 [Acrodontium crateriforme]